MIVEMDVLTTRFTRAMTLKHPIASAPMAFAAGGALAAAVSRAGGLGLIGGGYGDAAWLDQQFERATGERVGVGFISWSLALSPALLTDALRHGPTAVMLSFGDPRPFADEVRDSGATLICQCQNLSHVRDAVQAGADVIVAQGSEAGGHGALRGTTSLVPEVADLLAVNAPDTLLLAAGGIADGRGLAAAMMLGADGVLMGTRLWASAEALVKDGHHRAILATDGDGTLRTRIPDIVRKLAWPRDFTARIRRNGFTERWHGREEALLATLAQEGPRYAAAFDAGDPENAAVWFGEAAGLVHSHPAASTIMEDIVAQAVKTLRGAAGSVAVSVTST